MKKTKKPVTKDFKVPTEVIVNAVEAHNGNVSAAAKYLGVAHQTLRARMDQRGLTADSCIELAGSIRKKNMKHVKGKSFILSWAQNNTEVHPAFLLNLKALAYERFSKILIRQAYYHNKLNHLSTSPTREKAPPAIWDKSLKNYLIDYDCMLNKRFGFMGAVNISPTAKHPLNNKGIEPAYTSAAFAHPRLQLMTVPTPDNMPPLLKVSTGSVTKRNYSHTDAGRDASIHHVYGATLVEFDDYGNDYVYQLIGDEEGTFYFLDWRVKNGEIKKGVPIEALVCGDLHAHQADLDVVKHTRKLIERVRPKDLVLHDIFDGASVSHHRKKDLLDWKKQNDENFEGSLLAELQYTRDMVLGLDPTKKANIYIVQSNHDEWLRQYLKEDHRPMPLRQARMYIKLVDAAYDYLEKTRGQRNTDDFNALKTALLLAGGPMKGVKFLTRRSTLKRMGVELALHGDKGIGGSRGNVNSFAKYSNKTITGHSHTPSITGGNCCVGTMTGLSQDYSRGYSRWDWTHCLLYPNKKRSLVFCSNKGFWR